MTLYEFNLLSEQQQATALWDSGEFFLNRVEGIYMVLLYKIHDFYVEVYYDQRHNQIVRFKAFSSKKELEQYFDLQKN